MSLSDPLRAPGATPPRAEPTQPDRPGRGEDREQKDESATSSDESLARQIEQSKTALDNVGNP